MDQPRHLIRSPFAHRGVVEIYGITDITAEEAVLDICQAYHRSGFPRVVVFTDITHSSAGRNLYKFVTDNLLGDVARSRTRLNPNSGNRIIVWIWTLDREALRTWWDKTRSKIDG